MTRISKPTARLAMARPMLPSPTITIVDSVSAVMAPLTAPRPQTCCRWLSCRSCSRRVSVSRRPKVCSAMVAACPPRVLVTVTSLSTSSGMAASVSIPAPVEWTQRRRGPAARKASRLIRPM